MKGLSFLPIKPDFSSWPISTGFRILLLKQEKWPDYFSVSPATLSVILNNLYEQIKCVDFFSHPPETSLFFEFLRKLVESKPQENNVLREFSLITAGILDKLSLESRFDSKQEAVVIHYLKLLALMLEPNYRYLFEKAEISLWTNDFQKISHRSFNSSELLSQFRSTLQLSFQSLTFIKNYPALIQTIEELASSLDKVHVESNELAAMKLFDTLGVLDHTLKTSQVWRVKVNQATIKQSIQSTRNVLYDQFRPYVEENLLKFIFYKSFLAQSYPNSTNLSALCDSENYQAQCKSDYIRYKDKYSCATDQLPNFSIVIKNNNCTKSDLYRLCVAMRSTESFVFWMEELGFKPSYNVSQYFLHLADSKKNFLIDKFLYERDDPSETSHTVLATYFPPEKFSTTDPLLGSTCTFTTDRSALKHEYIHHLSALFMNDLELDLTSTEGIAELFAGGICSERQINDLRNFVNDTFIFEFFRARKYPFYFNALKWIGYLINEDPELFKTLVSYLQKNNLKSFYATIDIFIGNTSNIDRFVVWSRQHVNMCNHYLSIFPDGHQPPLIYLNDIKTCLNQTQTTIDLSNFNFSGKLPKRDLLAYSEEELPETILVSSVSDIDASINQEFKQQVKLGTPLFLSSLLAGFSSAGLDDVGLANQDNHPSLQAYINYGFKPFVFAIVSAGLNSILFDDAAEVEEKFARLFTYFVMNYLSVIIAQPLTQKLAETIHNKILCFFVQTLTWTLLWNPSLFISENSRILPTLFLHLVQGLCFKVGEETYKLGKNAYACSSSFWHKPKQPFLLTEDDFSNDDEEMQISKIGRSSR